MPKEKSSKALSVDDLRHAEYYNMQQVFDDLYARSKKGECFTNLMNVILSRENILLAYRNIKTNTGSRTPGTDNLNISNVGSLTPDEVVSRVRYIVAGSQHGYRPRPVRRKDIPKPNGTTRPLGIPCIWDRLIQQCIKQVMEPICEAKFSEHSYGFRPNRSVEHAIAETYNRLQLSHLHYVVEFDVKGFFDNVNHKKLIRQIWTMGIRDTALLQVIRRILKAPIQMPDRTVVYPDKGTPQGGIISPLLANVVLNELDHWVENNWEENPVVYKYSIGKNSNGSERKSSGYSAMRRTNLKEMHIVRYADDFRIFCRTKGEAERTKIAVTQWLWDRLKLEVSPEKTRVVNVKRRYSEFLGFKIKVHRKGQKMVVKSHICDKRMQLERQKLGKQAKCIERPDPKKGEEGEIRLYNSMVRGMQNYYSLATDISADCRKLQWSVSRPFTNRLGKRYKKPHNMRGKERKLTEDERKRYGKSDQLRYVAGSGLPIYPIGFVHCKKPMNKKRSVCCYTPEGRKEIHENLRISNVYLMLQLMAQPLFGRSAEYADNRISLFSAQWGKCAVTGKEFYAINDIHCHHKKPRNQGGGDEYGNLTLVLEPVHRLIHASRQETIDKLMSILNLDSDQMKKLNKLRQMVGNAEIA